jgi:hypothetical protein
MMIVCSAVGALLLTAGGRSGHVVNGSRKTIVVDETIAGVSAGGLDMKCVLICGAGVGKDWEWGNQEREWEEREWGREEWEWGKRGKWEWEWKWEWE